MPEPSLGYRLIWSDFSGYVEGTRRLLKHGQRRAALPEAQSEIFPSKTEAEAALQARGDGIVASVLPVTLKTPKPAPALLDDLPIMTKRLTP